MVKKADIKVLTASIRGALHKSQNLPCQDYCCAKKLKNKLVAVVSDGAGSAKYGKTGARIVCETLCNLLMRSSLKDIEKNVVQAIETARIKLILHSKNRCKNEKGMIDFSATIIGVFCHRNKGIFFHIGDGAGIAYQKNNLENPVISEPENGAFSCETYFYTMPDWLNNLRFTPFEKSNRIILMTDGVTNFAFSDDFRKIQQKFLVPIVSYLEASSNISSATRALKNTLNDPKAQRINADDKTFLWARLS